MKTDTIEILKAEYLGQYKIKLNFSDRTNKTVDFEGFLKAAVNPMTKKFLDKNKFKAFKLNYGDLIWGDYEMCFPVWDLHEGKL